jgi:hypothetical protein
VRPKQDPTLPEARQILFSLNDAGRQPPPPDDVDLADSCERVVHALNHLYPAGDPASEAKFRLNYHDVFGLAGLALEKEHGFDTATSKKQLDRIKRNIVEDEGPRIKNSNIKVQLHWAAWISFPVFGAFLLFSLLPDNGNLGWLKQLGANRATLANFMLLWVGCCLGVCLSYALRTQELTLEDLVTPDSDFLTPAIRLGLTGTLAMLLVMLSMLDIVDLTIAKSKLSDIADPNHQMFAFIVGTVCGIAEKLLPTKFMTATKDLVGGIK